MGESEPFICELLHNLVPTIQDLEQHQVQMFYETVGLMISADDQEHRRKDYLVRTARARRAGCTLDRLRPGLQAWRRTRRVARAGPISTATHHSSFSTARVSWLQVVP